jgi:hypothetical protein
VGVVKRTKWMKFINIILLIAWEMKILLLFYVNK